MLSGTWGELSTNLAQLPPSSGSMTSAPSPLYQGRDQSNPGDWHDLGARPRRPLGNGNQRDKKKARGTGEQTSAGNQKKKKPTKLGRQATSKGTQKVVKETKITMPDDGDSSSNSDSPSILSTVCTLATGAAIIAAGFGIPILSAASTGLSSLNNALGRSERELPGGSASGAGGAGSTPTPEPVNGEAEFPMPPTTQTAEDATTGADWLRQAQAGGSGHGHTRVKRVVEGDVVDTRSDSHKALVRVKVPATGSDCTGAVVDKNKVLTAAHCVV